MAAQRVLMAQLYVNIVGYNSAGKTSLAKKLEAEFGFNRINGDDFRLFVYEHFPYFHGEKLGKRSPRNDNLNQFLVDYRIKMAELLLGAGQNVIIDGSGATKAWRSVYLNEIAAKYPSVKRIIIYAQITEPELLKRLSGRDQSQNEDIWQDHYHNFRKELFEPPTAEEADNLIIYDQNNYRSVKEQVENLLALEA